MKDLLKKELIGLDVTIIDSKNKSNIGINGRIIDETKNSLTIKTESGEKMVLKENVTLGLREKGLKVEGRMILGRPEERIKKKS